MARTFEQGSSERLSAYSTTLTRAALGIIFLWFGLLKFCPGLCDVELMAQQTMVLLTFSRLSPATCTHILAVWECAMGLTLLAAPARTRWGALALKVSIIAMLMHLAGTFLPLLLFPLETWKHFPYAPTLVGQYILKNLVLAAAAASVGASLWASKSGPVLMRATVSQHYGAGRDKIRIVRRKA